MRHTLGSMFSLFTLFATTAAAAPMSGVFTVGGTSPSFATLQQAAESLMVRGVSGAVEIRLRPGTYMQNGGVDRALFLSNPIPGASAAQTVTFTSDLTGGGNVDNVVLAIDKTTENGLGVAEVRADFVRFRNLTFADRDSGQAGARYLLQFIGTPGPTNQTLEGLQVESCKFVGNPVNSSALALVTDTGITGFDDDVRDIVVSRCTFTRTLRAIEFGQDGGDVPGTVVIQSNTILQNHNSMSGSGNPLGFGILAAGLNVTVRDNLIDFANGSGYQGIIARFHDTGVVERNHVKNGGPIAFTAIQVEDYFFHDCDSAKVVNNMVSGLVTGSMTGISVQSRRTLIAHNSVVLTALQGGSDRCLSLDAQDCRVFANILDLRGVGVNSGFHGVFEIFGTSSATLVSDFNVFNREPVGYFVRDGSTAHNSLDSWRTASGEDAASVVRVLEFVNFAQDLHLTECQAQDASLRASALPGVPFDFDGQVRTHWVRGADEAFANVPHLFDVARFGLAGTPFAVDAAPFDNLTADGLAVPDYDNNTVHLFHGLPVSRSFAPAANLGVPFPPTCARFMDLDVDGNLDVIIGGEAAAVVVYWGNGSGGFPDSTVVPTWGRVVSMEPQPSTVPLVQVCLLAEDNGFLPDRSFLGVLAHQGGRSLCHDVMVKGSGLPRDTIQSTLKDIVAANFSPDPGFEIVGIGLGPGLAGKLVSYPDFEVAFGVFTQCDDAFFIGNHTTASAPIASYGGHNANIAHGDFDGDGDLDVITTGFTTSQIVLLRNNGAMAFTPQALDVNDAQAVVALDYDNDGDLDVASLNRQLQDDGVSLYRNDGTGGFTRTLNCFQGLGSGTPFGATTGDFDLDGRTDIAVVSSFDSLFVLYNAGATVTGAPPLSVATGPGPSLAPCAPNPVVGSGRIGFTLPGRTHVRLALFDMQGRRMATLVDKVMEAGRHDAQLVAGALPSGVYLCRLEAGGTARSRKLMVVR